jgi:hypothetical protein
MKTIQTLLLTSIILLLINCSNIQTTEKTTTDQNEISNQTAINKKAYLSSFTESDVARFAISTIMGQPPKKIKVETVNGLYFVSYVRKSDSKLFEYKIKIDDNKIVWGNIDGRWRDSEYDERISFKEEGNKLTITQAFSDGTSDEKVFKMEIKDNH